AGKAVTKATTTTSTAVLLPVSKATRSACRQPVPLPSPWKKRSKRATVTTTTQMTRDDRSSPTDIGRHPIHTVLVSFSAACFVGALVTDWVYWRSTSFIWETF